MAKHPAVFIDRDGTIIDDVGYIKQPNEVKIFPFTFNALSILQKHFLLFIITNQSGIAKGITTETEVLNVNNYILQKLRYQNIIIHELFCCPHKTEDNCDCKKPKTMFIEKANRLYNLDLKRSYILGDHPSDVQCGINAGLTPIYLLTGHGIRHQHEISNETIVFSNILEASKYIIYKNNRT